MSSNIQQNEFNITLQNILRIFLYTYDLYSSFHSIQKYEKKMEIHAIQKYL